MDSQTTSNSPTNEEDGHLTRQIQQEVLMATLSACHGLQALSLRRSGGESLAESLELAHSSSGALIEFINSVISGAAVPESHVDLYSQCLSTLLTFKFMTRLLELRQLTREISEDVVPPEGQEDLIVTWVDVLLSTLEEMIIFMAEDKRSSEREYDNHNSVPLSLQSRQAYESLRVACQLPQSFQTFPNMLLSKLVSPAAKRMCLHILYAIFVIGPANLHCDPWVEAGYSPYHLVHCIQAYLDSVDISRYRMISPTDLQKVGNAMAISLYACADTAVQRVSQLSSPVHQPRTLSLILEITYDILAEDDPTTGRGNKPGKFTLLRWGNTVSWFWTKWTNPQLGLFETVVKLTSEWFLQFPDLLPLAGDSGSTNVDTLLLNPLVQVPEFPARLLLDSDSVPWLRAIHFLCQSSHTKPSLSGSDLQCLHNVLWGLLAILSRNGYLENVSTTLAGLLSSIFDELLFIFISLGETSRDIKVKLLALKCLSKIAERTVTRCGQKFSRAVFTVKLESAIAKATQLVQADTTSFHKLIKNRALSSPDVDSEGSGDISYCHNATRLERPCSLLRFLSLIISAGEPAPESCWLFLSRFMAYLVEKGWLYAEGVSPALYVDTCETVLSVALKCDQDGEYWSKQNMISIAGLAPLWFGYKLPSMLSSYIMITGTILNSDQLLLVETWDHLRETLILACAETTIRCGNCNPHSDDVLGVTKELEYRANMCSALDYILRIANSDIRRYLASSSLTLTMIEGLQVLCNDEENHLPSCFVERGKHLIEQVCKVEI